MKHSLQKYLEDVRLSILDIEEYLAPITAPDDISDNKMLFDALCRRFSIVGEAIYQASKISTGLTITDKQKIAGLRHTIVHDYDTVRAADLLLIAQNNLPLLKQEVEDLLNRH